MLDKISLDEKVKIWKSRFEGRTDCFNIDLTKYDEVSSDPKVKVKKKQFLNVDENTEKWVPLSDSHIADHITGKAPIAILPKLPNDKIKFAVIDFDYPWDYADAVRVQKMSWKDFNVPCYLAQSSRKGWHLIYFFSDWIDMKVFTSFWHMLRSKSGIDDDVKNGRQTEDGKYYVYPEVFPRVSSYGDQNPMSLSCGAIKPPMVEPRMAFGKNAFYVEFSDQPILVDDQWGYLSKTICIEEKFLESVCKSCGVDIKDPSPYIKRATRTDSELQADIVEGGIKPKGSFEKVLAGCAALRAAYLSNTAPTHFQRLALAIVASNTLDGKDIILKLCNEKPEIWDRTKTEKNLAYIGNKYRPYTCEKMQELGVCLRGVHPSKGEKRDHCLEPRVLENGDTVPPSPYRFALKNSAKDDLSLARFIQKFQEHKEILSSCASKNLRRGSVEYDNAINNLKEEVIKAYQYMADLPAIDAGLLSEEIANTGLKKSELKSLREEGIRRRQEAKRKEISGDRNTKQIVGKHYREYNNQYHMIIIGKDGNEEILTISDFIVVVTHDIIRAVNLEKISDITDGERYFEGLIMTKDNDTFYFSRFPVHEMYDGKMQSLFKHFSKIAGMSLNCLPGYEQHVRLCISAFNKNRSMDRVKTKVIIEETGWNSDKYIVENMMISKDGIFSLEAPVNIDGKEMYISVDDEKFPTGGSSGLKVPSGYSGLPRFEYVNESTAREILQHILKDFLEWHEHPITYTSLAFTVSASIQGLMEKSYREVAPILYIAGLSGKGKTDFCKALQKFYGPWENIPNFESTNAYLKEITSCMKDAIICIDDYKRNQKKSNDLVGIIHHIYDRTTRGKLRHDGKFNENARPAKGLVVMSGEDVFENEASAASRCLFVRFDSFNKSAVNKDQFERVKKYKNQYSGIMPYFIQFCAALPHGTIDSYLSEGYEIFSKRSEDTRDNAARVFKNCCIVYAGARAFFQMCYERFNLIDAEQFKMHMENAVKAINLVLDDTFKKIREDKAGANFISELSEIISTQPDKYWLHGFSNPPNNSHAILLGWRDEKDPNILNLFPESILQVLKDKYKSEKLFQSKITIGQTLLEEGVIASYQDSIKPFRKVQFSNPITGLKTRVQVLSIYANAIFDDPENRSVAQKPPVFGSVTPINYAKRIWGSDN